MKDQYNHSRKPFNVPFPTIHHTQSCHITNEIENNQLIILVQNAIFIKFLTTTETCELITKSSKH